MGAPDWSNLPPADLAAARRAVHSKRWGAPDGAGARPVSLALGLADMDLPSPEFVGAALRARLDHPIYGYTRLTPSLPGTIGDWYQRHTGWRSDPAATTVMPFGLKTAIRLILSSIGEPDRPALVLTPVYDGLRRVGRDATAGLVEVPLVRDARLRYDLDLARLRAAVARSGARTLLLCSPHNPLGRVWTAAELAGLAEVAAESDLLVVSDEVHSPLTHPPARHHPWPAAARHDRWALVSSVGKAFNMSGIAGSWLVCGRAGDVPPVLRELKSWGYHQGSMLGDVVMDACLCQGDEWLAERVARVRALVDHACAALAAASPAIGVAHPAAGYLLWLDLRRVVPRAAHRDTAGWLHERTGVRVVDGNRFGAEHAGFVRLNVATSGPVLDEALARLASLPTREPAGP